MRLLKGSCVSKYVIDVVLKAAPEVGSSIEDPPPLHFIMALHETPLNLLWTFHAPRCYVCLLVLAVRHFVQRLVMPILLGS